MPDIDAVLHSGPRTDYWHGFNAGVQAAWRVWEEAGPAATQGEDAEALAHAVSASLTHGEDSPLADALKVYLERHPWSDL